jgi:hypothetical protein
MKSFASRVVSAALILIVLPAATSSGAEEKTSTPPKTENARAAIETEAPPLPISGREISAESILPADVLARVKLVRAELNRLREHLGKERIGTLALVVTNAAPRQVLFQARSLSSRADQLSFETTRRRSQPRPAPVGEVRPLHVWITANDPLARVKEAQRAVGMSADAAEKPEPVNTEPSEVFSAILATNREVNSLVVETTDPRDVYQMVTQGVHYAARLLAQFPTARRVPHAPPFVHGKQPHDVYGRLLTLLEILSEIGRLSNVNVATIALIDKPHEATLIPSDVYDLAALASAELAAFYSMLPGHPSIVRARTRSRECYWPQGSSCS